MKTFSQHLLPPSTQWAAVRSHSSEMMDAVQNMDFLPLGSSLGNRSGPHIWQTADWIQFEFKIVTFEV
jgi:hypothetical protein